jgi:hypothetical protein
MGDQIPASTGAATNFELLRHFGLFPDISERFRNSMRRSMLLVWENANP